MRPSAVATLTGGPPGALADEPIDEHGDHQHHPEHHVVPVRVDPREDDPLRDHAVDERPEDRADRGAVAASQQRPADHDRDDREELALLAPQDVRTAGGQDLDHGHQPGGDRRADEERDLDEPDRHPDVAGGLDVAADAEDPVPERGPQQDPGRHRPPDRATTGSRREVRAADRDVAPKTSKARS
jgi:hypothetical protein